MHFDHIVDLRNAPEFGLPEEAALFVHIYPDAAEFFAKKGPKIYRDVVQQAARHGVTTYLLIGGDFSLDFVEARDDHFHIAQLDRPFEAPNLIYIMPSYMRDFWYIDPEGVRNHSSIRKLPFEPNGIDGRTARYFFFEMHTKFAKRNQSKWPQEAKTTEAIKEGNITLALQADKVFPYDVRYVDTVDLIEATIATRGSRPLYIKPHPKAPLEEQERLIKYHQPQHGIEVTVASIHSLLPNADYLVTQSSAVAFEANLHKTPAIVSGQVDFWHNAVELKRADKMEDAVNEVLTREFQFIKYVYWFLHENLYETLDYERPKIWERLKALGLPFEPEDPNKNPF